MPDFRYLYRGRPHIGGLTQAQIAQMNIRPRQVDEVPAGIQHAAGNLGFLRQRRDKLFGDVELTIAHLKLEKDYVDLIPNVSIKDFTDVEKELTYILVDLDAMQKRLSNRRHLLQGKSDFRNEYTKLCQHSRDHDELKLWVFTVASVVEETRMPRYPKLQQRTSSNDGSTATKVVIVVLVMLWMTVIMLFYYWVTGVERQLDLASRLLED